MADNNEQLQQRIEELEREVAQLNRRRGRRRPPVRKRSERKIWGLPLYDVAIGPDPSKGETCGRARGFFAVGDMATGVFALGGIAIGVFALGGVSFGALIGIGGVAVGGVAIGGAAVGVVAIGGTALGLVAIGGAAFGYFDPFAGTPGP